MRAVVRTVDLDRAGSVTLPINLAVCNSNKLRMNKTRRWRLRKQGSLEWKRKRRKPRRSIRYFKIMMRKSSMCSCTITRTLLANYHYTRSWSKVNSHRCWRLPTSSRETKVITRISRTQSRSFSIRKSTNCLTLSPTRMISQASHRTSRKSKCINNSNSSRRGPIHTPVSLGMIGVMTKWLTTNSCRALMLKTISSIEIWYRKSWKQSRRSLTNCPPSTWLLPGRTTRIPSLLSTTWGNRGRRCSPSFSQLIKMIWAFLKVITTRWIQRRTQGKRYRWSRKRI